MSKDNGNGWKNKLVMAAFAVAVPLSGAVGGWIVSLSASDTATKALEVSRTANRHARDAEQKAREANKQSLNALTRSRAINRNITDIEEGLRKILTQTGER